MPAVAIARSEPGPFLKWAGGKRAVLARILPLVPRKIRTYYEPFLGGGALFFALARDERRFADAVLADTNAELIGCYRAIQRDVEGVIRALGGFRYDEKFYYAVRSRDPTELPDDATRAARLIYLNRTGFNGLYRVNSSGRFNVPFGRYKRPRFCDPDRLRAVQRALARARLEVRDFEEAVAGAGRSDFVYFDPPYVPVSRTAYFTAYARAGFAAGDQQRLAALLRRLGQDNVPALLSNSSCPTTRQLYDGLPRNRVQVRRNINSDATRRGPVWELLVRSHIYATGSRSLAKR